MKDKNDEINKIHGCHRKDIGANTKVNFVPYNKVTYSIAILNKYNPLISYIGDGDILYIECPRCLEENINPRSGEKYYISLEARLNQRINHDSQNMSGPKRKSGKKRKPGTGKRPKTQAQKDKISDKMKGRKQSNKTCKLKSKLKKEYWKKLKLERKKEEEKNGKHTTPKTN